MHIKSFGQKNVRFELMICISKIVNTYLIGKGFAHVATQSDVPIVPTFMANQEEMRWNPILSLWNLLGLGVNIDYWKGVMPPATWGLIFDKHIMPKRIGMAEDPRTLFFTAAVYLFGHIKKQLNSDQIDKIKKLLGFQVSKLPNETIANIVIVIGENDKNTTLF